MIDPNSGPEDSDWFAAKRFFEAVESEEDRIAAEEAQREWDDAGGAQIAAELRHAGVYVEDVEDLMRPGLDGRPAVPILVKWLPRVTYDPLKSSIVWALARPWARPAVGELIAEYHRIDPRTDAGEYSMRYEIGAALSSVSVPGLVDEILAIALDRSQSTHRVGFVRALGRMKTQSAKVVPALVTLLDDREVAAEAIDALGALRADDLRDLIVPFCGEPDPVIQRAARTAVRKMDRRRMETGSA